MCHTKANYENSYSLVRLYKRRLDITWFARVATKAEQFYTIFIWDISCMLEEEEEE